EEAPKLKTSAYVSISENGIPWRVSSRVSADAVPAMQVVKQSRAAAYTFAFMKGLVSSSAPRRILPLLLASGQQVMRVCLRCRERRTCRALSRSDVMDPE